MNVLLVYPHQLFREVLNLKPDLTLLVEDELFFTQYKFHKQKIAYHKATMAYFFSEISGQKEYISSQDIRHKTADLFDYLFSKKVNKVTLFDPSDYLLERRIHRYARKHNIEVEIRQSPNWLCSREYILNYFKNKKRYFFTSFYIDERKRHGMLLDAAGEPVGGKWTFDTENRKKIPSGTFIPAMNKVRTSEIEMDAREKTERTFGSNPGHLNQWYYPITRDQSLVWLDQFLREKFQNFGTYQDAIVKGNGSLFHSILTPMLNVGLLYPQEVAKRAIEIGLENEIPLNALEGFLRQVIGWREYIRAVYLLKGVEERTKNFFDHQRKLPESFYSGTTGIPPVDDAIARMNESAYTHHIDRLMVLGNFMLLCEINPDEVYRWFMELFIDAYDWVMVTNVYGMSQFADGGLMSTKPYISGSNYILKMSNFQKGPWCEIWDGLFWRFIDKHRDFFLKNPRLGMMVRTFDKMNITKKEYLLQKADNYLKSLV
ncbi:MAG: cryptochrome/photolyase family protein [Flavobacteriales bacterium]